MAFRVYLFGEFRIEDEDGDPVKLGIRKAQLLLANLLLHAGQMRARERLVDEFWPESDEAKAERSLNQTLYVLRGILEPKGTPKGQYLISQSRALQFNADSDLWADIREFESLIKQADQQSLADQADTLQQAVELYRGDLLEGCYEDWCMEARESFRVLYTNALKKLIDYHTSQNNFDLAVELARKSLATDNFQEETHRQLMMLHNAAGDRAAALKQYQDFEVLLRDELEVEPLPETTALYEEIKGQSPKAVSAIDSLVDQAKLTKTPKLGSPFVNRTEQLTQFVEVWQQLEQGQGRSIWASGEAGVGKSRLVHECVLYASGQGALTLRGNCYEMEGGLPYQPLIEAFRDGLGKLSDEALEKVPERGLSQLLKLMPELEDRFPNLEAAAPLEVSEQERNRLFEGLCQCLEALAQHTPVVVIFDDVQWVEASTLEFIHFLIRQLPKMPVLLMAIYREGEVDEEHALYGVLQHLTRNDLIHHWMLQPLSAQETEALVHGLLNTEALETVGASVYEESKGMPFFAEELVKSLIESGALMADADGQWQTQGTRLADDVVPSGIRALVGTRLRRLNRASKQVLELVSVIGRSVSFDLLLEVMGPWQVELLKPVEDLLWARFLEESENRYRFQHDLVRQVIYQDLSPERKRQFHLRVAETLESKYEDAPNDPANAALPGEMATHFTEANKPKKALVYVLEAGRHAWFNTYAKEESLQLYQRALDLAESLNDEDKLMQAYKGLGEILSSTDEHDQGIEYSQKALTLCEDPQERAEIHCAIARGHHYKQDIEQALASCEQALEELDNDATTLQAAKVYSYTGNFLNWLLRYEESIKQGKCALDILEKRKEDRLKTLVLSQLGHAHSGLKDYDSASEYLSESVKLAEKTRDLGAISQSSFQLAMALYNTDKLTEAVAAWEKALEALRAMGDRHIEEAIQYNWLTFAHMRLGDLEQALTYAKLQLEKNEIAQREEGIANSQGMLGCVYDVLKKPKLAKSAFDKAFKLSPEDGRVYQGIMMSYLYMEQLDNAVEWLEKGESFLERRHIEYLSTCPTSSAFESFRKNRKFKELLKAAKDWL